MHCFGRVVRWMTWRIHQLQTFFWFAASQFEVDRVPLNYIGNFRAAVLGYAALIEASRHGADYSPAKQYRAAGRLLMGMEVLLCICFRYDSRRPLVHHATICQSLSTSGFERVRREFVALLKLWIGLVQCKRQLGW